MSVWGAVFMCWLVLVVASTFALWLRPFLFFRHPERSMTYPFVAGFSAVLPFVTCFVQGAWLSIARMRGEVWLL